MTRTTFTIWTLTLATIVSVSPQALAEDKLPSGEKIMDSFIKSTGGKSAYKRIENRVAKGTFSMPAAGMSMTITRFAAAPDKVYMRIESDAMGAAIEQGYDGEVAWTINPMGAQVMSGEQGDMFKREAIFRKDLDWRKHYKEVKCLELVEFDGMQCYKVELSPPTGDPEIGFFEKGTWLRRGSEMTMTNPMGKAKLISRMKGYKEVSGVLLAHKIEQTIDANGMKQEMNLTFDEISHNVDLPKDRFAIPEKIMNLIKAETDKLKKSEPKKDVDKKE